MPEYCEIVVEGHLASRWSGWFAALELTHLGDGQTLLSGVLPDQVALHSLFQRIRDLNLRLVSVTCDDPSEAPIGSGPLSSA